MIFCYIASKFLIDHDILLHRLEISFGLSGPPLLWFRYHLTDRTQMVILGDSRTSWVPVKFGVPQGSVLGPLLYIMFTANILLSMLNTRPLVISMLTMFRPLFMASLLT